MTGLEFKQALVMWSVLIAAFLVAPAILIAVLRKWTTCDKDSKVPGGCRGVSAIVIFAVLGVYLFFFWKMWNDNQHIEILIFQPLLITAVVTLHALAIVGLGKVFGLLLPAKEASICTEMYFYLLVGLSLLWLDLSRGSTSALVTWLGT